MRLINKSNISEEALNYINKTISRYRITDLKRISLGESNNKYYCFYGIMRWKTKDKKIIYTITAYVHKNWIYPKNDYLTINLHIKGMVWISEKTNITFQTYDEAILFVFFHEWFHYISKTRQICPTKYGYNDEGGANLYASEKVKRFQKSLAKIWKQKQKQMVS